MSKKFFQNTAIARTLKNRDGIAAIEFALIAPIMIGLYIGLAEISLLVTADRNVSHAASVTGDLATQVESLDVAEVENIFQATIAVMNTSYAKSADVTVDMRSFEVDSDGNKVEIGYAKLGSGLPTKFDPSGVNSTLLNETSGLVVTRISYNYKSPSREFVGTPTLSETFMLKPRKSATIPFVNGVGSTITCSLSLVSSKTKVTCA
ncbi:MAG: pilus assembly protein [Hyphomonadaceae bacterium]|nr:pilus assembly protein [Hyphomonadaceae bacterium]